MEVIFDLHNLQTQIAELEARSSEQDFWNNPDFANKTLQKLSRLRNIVQPFYALDKAEKDIAELYDMLRLEDDPDTEREADQMALQLMADLDAYELKTLLSGEHDGRNALLEINAGAGGSEACDWALMLHRMYTRWAETHGYKLEILSETPGDVTGYRSVQMLVSGENAYGFLKAEMGVHRLVRKSPFDSGNRRHTSFSSVFVYPEVDDSIEVEINPADLRVDTYRASGAGGQHINKTDSAVRITHLPTNIVVQCQSDRSQHRNRAEAMAMLKSRLYEEELRKRNAEKQVLEDGKSDIGWGHQIRSYVLDQSRIKDWRTNYEVGNTQGVLDGDLDDFISASLKQGV